MHTKIKLIFLLILLISFESHGQINELSMLGIDTSSFTQGQDTIPESDVEQSESKQNKTRNHRNRPSSLLKISLKIVTMGILAEKGLITRHKINFQKRH